MKTLLGVKGWTAVAAATLTVVVLVPLLNLVVPDGNVFHLSDYSVSLLGKILCYAICALAMDLIWGYTGILSLGHGLLDRKSTRLNSSHIQKSRMPSSA